MSETTFVPLVALSPVMAECQTHDVHVSELYFITPSSGDHYLHLIRVLDHNPDFIEYAFWHQMDQSFWAETHKFQLIPAAWLLLSGYPLTIPAACLLFNKYPLIIDDPLAIMET